MADGQVRRTVVLHLALPPGDHHSVERVEEVEAELQALPAADSNVPHQREVHRLVRAAAADVSTRLQTKTAVRRPGRPRGVVLFVLAFRATAPWIADAHNPRPIVWRARHLHLPPIVLYTV